MSHFFKSWRKRIGVLTLAMGCLFATGWVRSRFVADFVEVSAGAVGQVRIVSVYGFISMNWRNSFPKRFGRWRTEPISTVVFDGDIYLHDPFGDDTFFPGRVIRAPYCFIVFPFTVASAWLLLSKWRTGTKPPITRTSKNA